MYGPMNITLIYVCLPSFQSAGVALSRSLLVHKIHDRYQKFSRELPQTAWMVDGGKRMGKGSVEEIVADPVKEVGGLLSRR